MREKARGTVWTRCADVCDLDVGVDVDVVGIGIVVPAPYHLGLGGALYALRRGCDGPMAINQGRGETAAYCRRSRWYLIQRMDSLGS